MGCKSCTFYSSNSSFNFDENQISCQCSPGKHFNQHYCVLISLLWMKGKHKQQIRLMIDKKERERSSYIQTLGDAQPKFGAQLFNLPVFE